MKRTGFTLIELLVSMVISAGIITAVAALFTPLVQQLLSSFNFSKIRLKVVSPIEAIRTEVQDAKAVYTTSSECYQICMIDRTSGNRIFYYWSGDDRHDRSGTCRHPATQAFTATLLSPHP